MTSNTAQQSAELQYPNSSWSDSQCDPVSARPTRPSRCAILLATGFVGALLLIAVCVVPPLVALFASDHERNISSLVTKDFDNDVTLAVTEVSCEAPRPNQQVRCRVKFRSDTRLASQSVQVVSHGFPAGFTFAHWTGEDRLGDERGYRAQVRAHVTDDDILAGPAALAVRQTVQAAVAQAREQLGNAYMKGYLRAARG